MITYHRILLSLLVLGAIVFTQGARSQEQPRLFFEGDMVQGPSAASMGMAVCVLANQFKPGQKVVWRVRVRDQDGKNLDDGLLKSVVVELPDGSKFPAHFGPHPPKGPPSDHFWATSWDIPADYPTGTISYKVTATDTKGASATWAPFNMRPSQLTIGK